MLQEGVTDSLILEVAAGREALVRAARELLAKKVHVERNLASIVGPCPLVSDAIPALEREYVRFCTGKTTAYKMYVGSSFDNNKCFFWTFSYNLWREHIKSVLHYGEGANVALRNLLNCEHARVLYDFQDAWNKVHPNVPCEYNMNGTFMFNSVKGADDPLIAEIDAHREERERVLREERETNLRLEAGLEDAVGPCPSLLDAIPNLERFYVEERIHRDNYGVNLSFTNDVLHTPAYTAWAGSIDQAMTGHSAPSGFTTHFKRAALSQRIDEVVTAWNERHPQIPLVCENNCLKFQTSKE